MDGRVATIARATLLEAMHTRLAMVTVAILAALLAGSFFVESIAVTESERFQAGFYAATARVACVFIAALYVLASVTREFDDKVLDLLLALDLPRSTYVLGKLAGFLAVGALLAFVAALPAWLLANPAGALQWMLSLALVLGIVIAVALLCVVTFTQLMPAASFVAGFYLLARALSGLRLMSSQPVAESESLFHSFMQWIFEGLALVLPSLDRWTQTAWLVKEPAAWAEMLDIGGQSMLYVALLAAAAMFDFYRKNF